MKHYDVIVVGFGTAGAVAAIAAARLGAKVLVLERTTYPGGTMTGGGVPGFYGRHPYGLTKKLFDAAKLYAKCHGCSIVEALKALMESEALQAGCELVYEAAVYEVILEGKCVKGVRWAVDGELFEAESAIVIDCTAEAVVCRMAGCEYTVGRASDGLCNPYTFSVLCARTDDPMSVFVANFDAGRIDQYDTARASAELLRGLAVHIQTDYAVDSKTRHELMPADLCGVREGAHVITEDYITLQDFFDGKRDGCTDIITYAHSNIDTHANDMPLESTLFQDWMIASSMWGTEIWVALTRGCLVPRGWKGLLVAGRHLGVDHDLGHAVRMNDHVGRTGEAAGVMAALAVKSPSPQDVMALPFDEVTANMEQMENPLAENDRFMCLSDQEILDGLSGDTPGFAMWSARCRLKEPRSGDKNITVGGEKPRSGERNPRDGQNQFIYAVQRSEAERHGASSGFDQSLLVKWYQSAPEGSNLKANTAFTLALLDDSTGLPTLLHLARTRDEYAPKTSRKYNHKRGYVAVYLLGRLAAVEALPVLKSILSDLQMADKYEYHSHAIAALMRIANAHPEQHTEIADFLLNLVHNPEWSIWARLKGSQQYVPVQDTFRTFVERRFKTL
ncbi:MAG: FAD-dependent oxidoreductase [Victivallales bacterium]|nr:FAD-dependent oxidoreductase [Victivallales bacterium]